MLMTHRVLLFLDIFLLSFSLCPLTFTFESQTRSLSVCNINIEMLLMLLLLLLFSKLLLYDLMCSANNLAHLIVCLFLQCPLLQLFAMHKEAVSVKKKKINKKQTKKQKKILLFTKCQIIVLFGEHVYTPK